MRIENQQKAANPAHSVWVSANAGTGKTKVLTDRVLRLLLDGVFPSRILCITYTKAAAAEMDARIYKELGKWVVMPERELSALLGELTGDAASPALLKRSRMLFALVLEDPEGVRIETIHGFCQSLLRKFPLEAGVEPHFTVIDERTSSELLDEAKLRLVSRGHQADDAQLARALRFLISNITEHSFDKLMGDVVRQRRKLAELFAKPLGLSQLIARIYADLGVERDSSINSIFQRVFAYSDGEKKLLSAGGKLLAAKNASAMEAFQQWLTADIRNIEWWNKYKTYFLTDKDAPRKNVMPAAQAKDYPTIHEAMVREQERAMQATEQLNAFSIAQKSESLMVVAEALLLLYEQLKQQHAVLDYDDLIILALRLLHQPGISPWILFKLDNGLDHLLIDEAQDTSLEQWELVEALIQDFYAGEGSHTRPRSLFVVGDEKQSIYSFQGAAPKEFHSRKAAFTERALEAGQSFKHVKLEMSFRSTAPVLEAVDAVFVGESHEAWRSGQAGMVELWPLLAAEAEEDERHWPVATGYEQSIRPSNQLAQRIAGLIASWIEQGRMLPAKGRPVAAGDIMILVRKRGSIVYYLQRALKKHNIPVAGADRLMLADNIAVMDMLALAEFLLLPSDDLTLATLLKSPLCGLSEEELFALTHGRGKQSLWQQLYHSEKHTDVVERLSQLLARADYIPPYELFAEVLEKMGGREQFSRRMGEESIEPLDEFLAQALQFERTHAPSLQGFVQWVKRGDTEIKRDMEQGRDEVRIMTVHGAKGLQAPIVFLPDTMGMPPDRYNLLWTGDALFWEGSGARDVPLTALLRQQRKQDDEEEYRRLLYVAMTRAEDELYIAGAKDNSKEGGDNCWYHIARRALEPVSELVDVAFEGLSEPVSVLRMQTTQEVGVISTPTRTQEAAALPALPAFAHARAPEEPVPRRPLSPSRMEDAPPSASPVRQEHLYQRGILAHKLLELLPALPVEKQADVARQYLSRHGNSEENEQLVAEVMKVLRHADYAALFSAGALAEVAISGMVYDKNGELRVVNGQIDRLCVLPDRVLVVDYKTNRNAPDDAKDIPSVYLRQMAAYKALLENIYPNRKVECLLLWTEGPSLMPVPEIMMAGLDCRVVST